MSFRKQKVLIVDDEEQNVRLLSKIIQTEGHDVVTAYNGKEALEKFNEHSPDLVLLDVVMPEMNGYEVCWQIKQNPHFVPVVLITALDSPEHKIRGIKVGADDFLNKPFNTEELKARVRNLLRTKTLYDRLQSSISDMNLLVTYSEKTLNQFDPSKFSIEDSISHLIKKILRREDEKVYKCPQYLYIGINTQDETNGILYWIDKDEVKRVGSSISIKLPVKIAPGEPLAFNFYEQSEREGWEKLFFRIMGQPLNVLNLTIYVGERMTLLGINYNKVVDRNDAFLMKGLALTSGFLSAISEQMKEIDNAFKYTLSALARAAEVHDDETGSHIVRINHYAKELSEYLKMSTEFTDTIFFSAQMHDVGKIYIPSTIIKKPGPLTVDEYKTMKLHTLYGVKILGSHPRFQIAREVANYHHERWDGTGYPEGLKEDKIPVSARLVSICDVYDALRSRRSYKPPYDHETAYNIICYGDTKTKPEHFDPEVINAFKKLAKRFQEIFETLKEPVES
jgi:response regulator RpfG family c-di-GMP phosphodiesterase